MVICSFVFAPLGKFIFLSFLNGKFVRQVFLIVSFSFSTLILSWYSLLACKVSAENSFHGFIAAPWHMTLFFWLPLKFSLTFAIFFFIYFYQLEANYFTTLQWVLSYIDMNQPWSYMYSPSQSPLPPPSPPDPSGSSQCTRSEHLSHASHLGW